MASDIDMTQIAEVVELKAYETVNKYLEVGWLLLSTHLWDYGHPVERHQATVYVLGWLKSLGDPKYPGRR